MTLDCIRWDDKRRGWFCDLLDGVVIDPPLFIESGEVESVRDEHFKSRCLCFDGRRGWHYRATDREIARKLFAIKVSEAKGEQ
jgi:hypothetical protein